MYADSEVYKDTKVGNFLSTYTAWYILGYMLLSSVEFLKLKIWGLVQSGFKFFLCIVPISAIVLAYVSRVEREALNLFLGFGVRTVTQVSLAHPQPTRPYARFTLGRPSLPLLLSAAFLSNVPTLGQPRTQPSLLLAVPTPSYLACLSDCHLHRSDPGCSATQPLLPARRLVGEVSKRNR